MKKEELREARLAKGLTLDDAAAALGLSVSQVSRIERGQRSAGADDLARFAALYAAPPRAAPPAAALVPVVAEAAPGRWCEPGAFACAVEIPRAPGRFPGEEQFAVRIVGPQMDQRRFFEGDFAICAPHGLARSVPTEGDLVVVERRRGGLVETSLREVMRRRDGVEFWTRSSDPRPGAPLVLREGEARDESGADLVVAGLVIARYAPVG